MKKLTILWLILTVCLISLGVLIKWLPDVDVKTGNVFNVNKESGIDIFSDYGNGFRNLDFEDNTNYYPLDTSNLIVAINRSSSELPIEVNYTADIDVNTLVKMYPFKEWMAMVEEATADNIKGTLQIYNENGEELDVYEFSGEGKHQISSTYTLQPGELISIRSNISKGINWGDKIISILLFINNFMFVLYLLVMIIFLRNEIKSVKEIKQGGI